MRILLLSAYDAASHRYWREGLVRHLPEHEWTVLTLPPRHFSWRMRGNSLSWAWGERERLSHDYDLLIATSMTDLSALRGMLPALARVPTLVYFHENQFDYPASGNEFQSVEPEVLNLYTALCADRILFNSDYNRRTLLEGAGLLLQRLPDQVPAGLVARLAARSEVLPVPLSEQSFQPPGQRGEVLQMVWNHRWEFDKGPELLLAAMRLLSARRDDFVLHVVGQRFRRVPEAFGQLRELLGERIGYWGHIESVGEYRRLLRQADLVLSTALHDFQGIALLEGVAAGALPVVPDRLAYRELFPEECRYRGDDEAAVLAAHLERRIDEKRSGVQWRLPDLRHLGWGRLADRYREVIEQVVAAGAGT
ncbi:MAG: DUF3524 domain-containing protein [Sedimenticola sp.]|nr:DUF3524 domain-containing protein [Sedimenticola sp.]